MSGEKEYFIKTLDGLIEKHRELQVKRGNNDAPSDVSFTGMVYLFLKEKGWDVQRFAEDIEYLNQTKPDER